MYLYVKFERDLLNIFRVRALTLSGSTGGRGSDAKTIISPNTSFGDITNIISVIDFIIWKPKGQNKEWLDGWGGIEKFSLEHYKFS